MDERGIIQGVGLDEDVGGGRDGWEEVDDIPDSRFAMADAHNAAMEASLGAAFGNKRV